MEEITILPLDANLKAMNTPRFSFLGDFYYSRLDYLTKHSPKTNKLSLSLFVSLLLAPFLLL